MQLRYQLQTAKKGSLSVADYFNRVKGITDSLAAASHPVPDNDLILYILGGLGPGYEPFVTAITTRADPISSEDLHSLLLSHELHLDQFKTVTKPSSMAFLTTNTGHPSSFKSQSSTTTTRTNDAKSFEMPYRGRGRGRGRNQMQGRRNNGQNEGWPICQICSNAGHVSLDYYNRLNLAYQSRQPSKQLAAYNAETAT
ncbi:uncharacterized protein LOC122638694 [Telopea speciosissima]|uniref:uncharacterized protein LOC122638694 n=1 Tax=Telopea speciosissima TaxID=54955 RepID=UPI001CC77635|nr:uncharacterized protein LOC122638694 [Telopea speciosissima]